MSHQAGKDPEVSLVFNKTLPHYKFEKKKKLLMQKKKLKI